MTPLVVVLAAGGILGVAAPLVLGRLERLDRAPQTAAYLWIMATVGALSAVVLAGLLLLVGSSRLLGDLAVLLSRGAPPAGSASCSRWPAAPSPACQASPSLTIRSHWPTACPAGWGVDRARW